MIIREKYLKEIRPFFHDDLIKIITGIRRSGKSTILNQIIDEIKSDGHPYIYLNFEDEYVLRQYSDYFKLIDYIKSNLNEEKTYIFFDEIQMMDNWNLALKSLRLHNVSIFITGSNSKLLSSEFSKELGGRFVEFNVRPFVFREIQEYSKQLKKVTSINDYLVYGGFPKVLEYSEHGAKIRYLSDLNRVIIYDDLILRNKVRDISAFKRIIDFVLVSNARIFSTNSISRFLKSENLKISSATLYKYIDYMKKAYLIDVVKQFSFKAKRYLQFYEKMYNNDVSFNSLRQTDNRYDLSHNMENIVYNELRFQGFDISVFNLDPYEIDFLASKDNVKVFIQVALSVAEKDTFDREIRPFGLLDNIYPKVLITNDDFDYSTGVVRHIKFKDFLNQDLLDLLKQ